MERWLWCVLALATWFTGRTQGRLLVTINEPDGPFTASGAVILQTESPRNITVVTAHTYEISCSSNIGVTPVWRRNGSLVTSSQPISGTPGVYVTGPANQERVLVLQNITQSVVGTYVCLEGNSQDADSATFIVTTGNPAAIPGFPQRDLDAGPSESREFFHVLISATPPPLGDDVLWYFNGNLIVHRAPPLNILIIEANEISFPRTITTALMGTYTCVVNTTAGVGTATFRVQVWVKPSLTIIPATNITILVGMSVTIRCTDTEGSPAPTITWTYNNDPLKPDGRITITNDTVTQSSQLTITSLRPGDIGTYRCLAVNPRGSANKEIHVNVQYAPIFSGVSGDPTTWIVDDEVLVTAHLTGSNPPFTSHQLLKDSQLVTSNRIQVTYTNSSSNFTFVIPRVMVSDEGRYTLAVINPIGVGHINFTIIVYYAPIFSGVSGDPTTWVVDDEVLVTAHLTGSNPPFTSHQLLKDSQLVTSNRIQVTYTNSSSNFTFMIPHVMVSDEGRYTLAVINPIGVGHINFTIIVYSPPNLGEPRTTFFYGTVGRSATLNLTIMDAKPLVQPANVSWMFNNIPISIDGNKYIQDVTPDGRLATLTIRDLNLLDTGSYRANIRHISSDVPQFRMKQLFVMEPSYPPTNLTITSDSDCSVNLSWIPPQTDPDTATANTIVIEYSQDGRTWAEVAREPASNTAVTVRLPRGREANASYQLRARSHNNEFGDGRTSDSTARFTLYPESSFPAVTVHAVLPSGPDVLQVSWMIPESACFQFTSLDVRCISSSNHQITFRARAEALEANVSGLNPNTQYSCRVTSTLADWQGTPLNHQTISNAVQNPAPMVNITENPRSTGPVLVGETAVFTCQARAIPSSTITWFQFQNGMEVGMVDNGDDIIITSQLEDHFTTRSVLSVRVTGDEDFTEYFCVGDNQFDNSTSDNATLVQAVSPSFLKEPSNVTAATGDSISLNCTATGVPLPTIVWEDRRGSNITDDEAYNITTVVAENVVSVLEFVAFDGVNGSQFRCVAENRAGQTESELATIIIGGVPLPPNAMVNIITSRAAMVSWLPPFSILLLIQYNITWVRVDTREDNSTTVDADMTELLVTNLQPNQMYSVTVVAVNRVGASLPSDPVVFTTAEDVPEAPPTNITTSSTRRNQIDVSWEPPPLELQNGLITRYSVCYVVEGGAQIEQCVDVPSPSTSTTLTMGISSGTTYLIRVAAATAVGLGPFSGNIQQMTLSEPPSIPPPPPPSTNVPVTTTTISITLPTITNLQEFSHFWVVALITDPSIDTSQQPTEMFMDNSSFTTYSSSVSPGRPYIVAEISSTNYPTTFVLGADDNSLNDFPELYRNGPLQPNTEYSAFVWAFVPSVPNGSPTLSKRQVSSLPRQYCCYSSSGFHTLGRTAVELSGGTLAGSIIGGVVAVAIVVAVTVIVIVIAIFVANHHRTKLSIHQDVSRKEPANWSPVARSEDEDITTTRCEPYELTKLDHDQNPECEIPIPQSPANTPTSKSED